MSNQKLDRATKLYENAVKTGNKKEIEKHKERLDAVKATLSAEKK